MQELIAEESSKLRGQISAKKSKAIRGLGARTLLCSLWLATVSGFSTSAANGGLRRKRLGLW